MSLSNAPEKQLDIIPMCSTIASVSITYYQINFMHENDIRIAINPEGGKNVFLILLNKHFICI